MAMAWSDFFKRQRPSRLGADLREALFTAAAERDQATLEQLCHDNGQVIRDAFRTWLVVPVGVRDNPVALARYSQGMIAVASQFERAGDGSLMTMATGDPADNPLLAWQRDLVAAQALIQEGRATNAVILLRAALSQSQGLRGAAVDALVPRTLGMLGTALYRAGDTPEAVQVTCQARSLCLQLGDEEGVHVYTGGSSSRRSRAR